MMMKMLLKKMKDDENINDDETAHEKNDENINLEKWVCRDEVSMVKV